jgi:cell division protein FtsW
VGGWEAWSQWTRQLVFVFGGLVAMLVASRIPCRLWYARNGLLAIGLLLFSFILLLLVFVPGIGVEVKGARRWIQLGSDTAGLRLQSSELLKLALPIFLAVWMTRLADVRDWRRGFLPAVIVAGICTAVVGLEDYGTAALIAAVAGMMMLMAGARWLHLIVPVIPTGAAFLFLLISKPHRMERIVAFRDIWADPQGTGYQAIQSLCTIAGGGWWGAGLGQGIVKQYLPEAHNDFIFAVICEELGIIGAMAVIALFIAFLWNAHKAIRLCAEPTGRLLAFGLALTIGLQAAMNIAVVTVSVPTKGISLPLVSAGGSGAICLGAMVGVLASIPRTARSEPPAGAGGPASRGRP